MTNATVQLQQLQLLPDNSFEAVECDVGSLFVCEMVRYPRLVGEALEQLAEQETVSTFGFGGEDSDIHCELPVGASRDRLMRQTMDQDKIKDVADRDQLWATLRELREEIDRLAAGDVDSSERQQRLSVLLARIVAAELDYRALQ